jgi:hypothetical protein
MTTSLLHLGAVITTTVGQSQRRANPLPMQNSPVPKVMYAPVLSSYVQKCPVLSKPDCEPSGRICCRHIEPVCALNPSTFVVPSGLRRIESRFPDRQSYLNSDGEREDGCCGI